MQTAATENSFALDLLEKTIPTQSELASELPLHVKEREFIHASRKSVEAILHGKDPRKILVVGPCSIHDEDSTYEYAEKLQRLSERVKDRYFLVMRAYFEKPRTSMGWKGFLFDPDLDGSYDMQAGLFLSRKILLKLAQMGVAAGSELLDVNTAGYLSDLLSWGCIGARTSSSQTHRQLGASLPFPLGFKNTTDGNIVAAINGILVAGKAQYFLGVLPNGTLSRLFAPGNRNAHLILRGSDTRPNYDVTSIKTAHHQCVERGVLPKIFVDCAHGNSGKCPENQMLVYQSVLAQNMPGVVGMMIESHLHFGAQPITPRLKHGVSITDPCLDWDSTESLILN